MEATPDEEPRSGVLPRVAPRMVFSFFQDVTANGRKLPVLKKGGIVSLLSFSPKMLIDGRPPPTVTVS